MGEPHEPKYWDIYNSKLTMTLHNLGHVFQKLDVLVSKEGSITTDHVRAAVRYHALAAPGPDRSAPFQP